MPEACYKFLDKVSDIRNSGIHDDPHVSKFTEHYLMLFSCAHAIADKIHSMMKFDWGEEISSRIVSDTEKAAEQLLIKFDTI